MMINRGKFIDRCLPVGFSRLSDMVLGNADWLGLSENVVFPGKGRMLYIFGITPGICQGTIQKITGIKL